MTRTSYVYVAVHRETLHGKVGTSVTPQRRYLDVFDVEHRGFVDLVSVLPGAEELEGFIHYLLLSRKLEGEWFDFSGIPDVPDFCNGAHWLWKSMGEPDEYRAASFQCAQDPWKLVGPKKDHCVVMPRYRNVPVSNAKPYRRVKDMYGPLPRERKRIECPFEDLE